MNTFSSNGLTVTELGSYTSLHNSHVILIEFEVISPFEVRTDVLDYNDPFDKTKIDFLLNHSNENRSEIYHSMIF